MENCHNKLTREETLNLINLKLAILSSELSAGDITTINAAIAVNTSNISTNTTNISTNTTDVATNVTDIGTNTTNIATNVTNIGTNATDIAALELLDSRTVISNDNSIEVDATDAAEYDVGISFTTSTTSGEGEPGILATIANNGGVTPGNHLVNIYKRYMLASNLSSFESGVAAGAGSAAPNVFKIPIGPTRLSGQFDLTTFQINWDLTSGNGASSAWTKIATIPATYTPPVGEGSAISLYPASTNAINSIVFVGAEASTLSTDITLLGLIRVNTAGEVHIKLGTPITFNGTTVDEGFFNSSGSNWRAAFTGSIYVNALSWDWDG
jgi:hypothetical protein